MALQDIMRDYYTGNTLSSSTGLSIALNNVDGVSSIFKFGLNPAVGTTQQTIWEDGGLYVTPTTATVASITSTSVNDTALGSGARTIRVIGLDANFLEQEEDVTLDGTNVVLTTGEYIRLNRMFVLTAGVGAGAAGSISAIVDGKVMGSINDGRNQTQVAHYTIPANKDGYLQAVFLAVGQGKEMEASINVRAEGSVYRQTATAFLFQNVIDADFSVPSYLPPKTDIELRAKTSTGTLAANGSMTIILKNR